MIDYYIQAAPLGSKPEMVFVPIGAMESREDDEIKNLHLGSVTILIAAQRL
jgi:hypothetical protein